MLKKSLFVVAAVALLAVAAQAGEIKYHSWPTTFVPMEIAEIPVTMDVGYWVAIQNQGDLKIKLAQVNVHTYEGCTDMSVKCNFDVTLTCSIAAAEGNPVPGNYSCSITGGDINNGGGTATVCAKLTNADLSGTAGGTTNVKVANVTIWVVPR